MIRPLRQRRDFVRLAADGKVRSAGPLRIRRALDSDLDAALVAFALPRNVGTAVVRNRLRRQLREILRQVDRTEALPGGRYLVMASPEAATVPFTELQGILISLMANRTV